MSIGAVGTSFSGSTTAVRPYIPLESGSVDAFAKELTRRAAQEPLAEGAKRTVDDAGLEQAIESAVGYVQKAHGDQAARTVMGIVLSGAGDGPLSEASLGDGFVNALEFIDRQFGTAAGDQAIANFNGALNNALNGYFQNGQDESFLAQDMDQAAANLSQASGQVVSAVLKRAQEKAVASESMLYDQAKENTDAFLESGGRGKAEDYPLIPPQADPLEAALNGEAAPAGTGPAAMSAASTTASGQAAQATAATSQADASAAQEATPQRLQRRQVSSRNYQAQGGYTQSGLRPGMLLDASA